MTDLATLFRRAPQGTLEPDPQSKLSPIEFDVIVSESHKAAASTTSHPVEDGSTISDHVSLEPATLDLTGIISRHPVMYAASLSQSPTRDADAYEALQTLHTSRTPMTVTTSIGVHQNMIMTSLEVSRDLSTATAIVARMSFVRIAIVTAETQELAAAPEHRKTTDGGTQATKPASAEATAAAKSTPGVAPSFASGLFGG